MRRSIIKAISSTKVNKVSPSFSTINYLQQNNTRFYSTKKELKQQEEIKLKIIKADREKKLKIKIEEQKKKQKELAEKRAAEKKKKEEQLFREKQLKKKHDEKLKKVKKEEDEKLKNALKKKKQQLWVREKKQKEAEKFKEISEKSKLKLKSKRDEKAPFQPKSAFVWYYQSNFSDLSKELKEKSKAEVVPVSEVMKVAAEKFKTLSQEEADTYVQLAHHDKMRYEKQKSQYLSVKKRNKKKVSLSPFFRFLAEFRSKLDEKTALKSTEITKLAAEKWRSMSEEEKSIYRKQYEDEKAEIERLQEEKDKEMYAEFQL